MIRTRLAFELGFVSVFTVFLFAHLGHYALWDDEANTAIFARNLVRTGDLNAYDGRNLIAFRDGLELTGLLNRQIPPLQYGLAALGLAFDETSKLAARFPFATCGVLLAVLLCAWMRRARLALRESVFLWGLLASNISLILYLRQCRYYAPAILLSVVLAWLYFTANRSWFKVAAIMLAASALFMTHYLAFAAVVAIAVVDYLLYARKEGRLTRVQVAAIAVSQVLSAGLYWLIWKPTFRPVVDAVSDRIWLDKLKLWAWNIRDFNTSEFSPMAVILIAFGFAAYSLFKGNDGLKQAANGDSHARWIARAFLALVVYAGVVALGSPQPVHLAALADIRYMAPAIPLGVFLVWRAAEWLEARQKWAGWALVSLTAFTTVPNLAFLAAKDIPARSTVLSYAREMASPPPSPYSAAIDWLRTNAEADESVFAVPDFALYPLMFELPQLKYAWQLSAARRTEFPQLEDIHFRGVSAPDVLIGFARGANAVRSLVENFTRSGVGYRKVAALDVYGVDMTRPEMFWRSFVQMPVRDMEQDGIHIWRR